MTGIRENKEGKLWRGSGAQTSLDYVLIIGGGVLLTTLALLFVRTSIFQGAASEVNTSTVGIGSVLGNLSASTAQQPLSFGFDASQDYGRIGVASNLYEGNTALSVKYMQAGSSVAWSKITGMYPTACAVAGQFVKGFKADGTIDCAAPAGGGGSGTVTSVTAGTGLAGSPNPISASGTISLNLNSGTQQSCTGTDKVSGLSPTGIVTCSADQAGSGSALVSVDSFTTPGTFTWTKPAGVTKVRVEVIGGGGGGGGGSQAGAPDCTSTPGTGGGGGGYAEGYMDVSAISSTTVIVGSAGIAGVSRGGCICSGGGGGNGGTSSFGTIGAITATGGSGGNGGCNMNPVTGGVGINGVINAYGFTGGQGATIYLGGNSALGGGGAITAGGTGRGSGGGGGGNIWYQAPGSGAPGAVIIWNFK